MLLHMVIIPMEQCYPREADGRSAWKDFYFFFGGGGGANVYYQPCSQ
jgi:hypothetical protein